MRNYSRHNGKEQNGAIQNGIVVKREMIHRSRVFGSGWRSSRFFGSRFYRTRPTFFFGLHFYRARPIKSFRAKIRCPSRSFGPDPQPYTRDGPPAFLKAKVGSKKTKNGSGRAKIQSRLKMELGRFTNLINLGNIKVGIC